MLHLPWVQVKSLSNFDWTFNNTVTNGEARHVCCTSSCTHDVSLFHIRPLDALTALCSREHCYVHVSAAGVALMPPTAPAVLFIGPAALIVPSACTPRAYAATHAGFVWEKYDSQTFVGAEVFALINFVILLLFAVMLVVLQTGVSEQLGIGERRRTCIAWLPLRLQARSRVCAACCQGLCPA